MRRTKIICTLGPAVDDEKMIRKLIQNGMDCARFNFSHGTHKEQAERIARVRGVSTELGVPVALLLDTKGPEIRLGDFATGSVILKEGQNFILDTDKEAYGDATHIGITYDKLAKSVVQGTRILIDDGKIALKVSQIKGTKVVCSVINGGKVSNHKSINVPNVSIPMPYLSPVDKEDILFGIEQKFDYIAASFVRCADDVRRLRKFLRDIPCRHDQLPYRFPGILLPRQRQGFTKKMSKHIGRMGMSPIHYNFLSPSDFINKSHERFPALHDNFRVNERIRILLRPAD